MPAPTAENERTEAASQAVARAALRLTVALEMYRPSLALIEKAQADLEEAAAVLRSRDRRHAVGVGDQLRRGRSC